MSWTTMLAADGGSNVWTLVVIGTFVTGGIIVYKLIDTIGRTLNTRQNELSRREIAAYVAEGSITPETAERLLRVGRAENWSERIAELVEAGSIDSDDAATLLKAGSDAAVPPHLVSVTAARAST